MFFQIRRLDKKDQLCFYVSFVNVKEEIDFLLKLRFPNLKIKTNSEKFGCYFIDKTNVLNNKVFFQFLFKLQNTFRLTFVNYTNDEWIKQFLFIFQKRKTHFMMQEKIYSQIMNQEKVHVKINDFLFLPTFMPKPFQKEHVLFALKNKRFANFSSPGSGKTIISYMSALSLYADKKINLLIVVGPKSAKNAWFEEWKRVTFTHIIHADEIFNFSDKSVKHIESFNYSLFVDGKLNLVFINFHKFQKKWFTQKFLKLINDYQVLLIIDEAHYIKNCEGALHINLLQLSSQIEYVQLLTGTPLPRFSEEGFYIINFLFSEVFKKQILSQTNFKCAFEKTDLGTIKDSELLDNLIEKFKLFFVRKTKQNLIDDGLLSPMQEIKITIAIDPVEKFLIDKLKNISEKINFISSFLEKKRLYISIRKMQSSSYPPLLLQKWTKVLADLVKDVSDDVDHEKIEKKLKLYKQEEEINQSFEELIDDKEIRDIINQYSSGERKPERWIKAKEILQEKADEKVIVWDVFKVSMQKFKLYLEEVMPEREMFLINGDVDVRERENIIAKFKESNNSILIASLATIAESVSLHREVDVAIYLYKNYIGAHFMQSKERIHRLVGKNEVQTQKTIYFIEAVAPSIDQEISNNLRAKEKEQSIFID